MYLITALLSDDTPVSLASEDTEEDSEDAFPHHLMINRVIVCSYNSWEHAWEDFGRCVRCTTQTEAVNVAKT